MENINFHPFVIIGVYNNNSYDLTTIRIRYTFLISCSLIKSLRLSTSDKYLRWRSNYIN